MRRHGGFIAAKRVGHPPSASITINDNGWFFDAGGSVNGLQTGTPRFQGQTLLHELGHATGVLLPDGDGSPAGNESTNIATIARNCNKAISSLSSKPQ
jgi:hypothetical protein